MQWRALLWLPGWCIIWIHEFIYRRSCPLKEAYLDNSSTTRVCEPAAAKVMELMTENYGNPSSLHTLGFRGEALASVASVSRIELLTKTDADEYAYLYRISGGEEQGIEPAARPVGTTITVRDLFYNTPARMKFLKKDTSEGNYVADVVTQLALSHPEVSFKFVRDGKPQFQTPGDGKLLGGGVCRAFP